MRKAYHQSRVIRITILAIDIAIMLVSFTLSDWLFGFEHPEFLNVYLLTFILTWIVTAQTFGIYLMDPKTPILDIFKTFVLAFLTQIPVFIGALLIIHLSVDNWQFLLNFYFLSGLIIIHSRLLYKFIYKYIEFSGFNNRKVIVIGTGKTGRELHHFFTKHSPGRYSFMGFFDDFPENGVDRKLVMGRMSDVKNFCTAHEIDEIYFAHHDARHELLSEIKNFADANTIYFRITPDYGEMRDDRINVQLFDTIPILTTRSEPLGDSLNLVLKRTFDVLFSGMVIVLIFPWLFPIIALAIKLESSGPLIFKQLRCGKKNRLFECYKFRSMVVNDETERQASLNDARITRVGKILRRTNLDELPQFFNVLIGNMSVVGPRPHAITQLEEYSHIIKKLNIRHFITPGITGYAQVSGYRGETRTPELMAKRVEYDVMYIQNWSLMLDLKIIAKTVWNMIVGDRNAY